MNMKFYMTPGSCSTGIHILLEEVGEIFEAHLVNLLAGDQNKEDYRQINPKGTIPTLIRKDGIALTDFISIAWWLGKTYPKQRLLPASLEDELQVLETMNYAVNTIHGQGFTRIFTTDKYSSDENEQEDVKARGNYIVRQGFEYIDKQLHSKDYVTDHFSVADAALFYVEFWADRIDTDLPANCQRHYQRMLNRLSVRQVLSEEGYGAMFAN